LALGTGMRRVSAEKVKRVNRGGENHVGAGKGCTLLFELGEFEPTGIGKRALTIKVWVPGNFW